MSENSRNEQRVRFYSLPPICYHFPNLNGPAALTLTFLQNEKYNQFKHFAAVRYFLHFKCPNHNYLQRKNVDRYREDYPNKQIKTLKVISSKICYHYCGWYYDSTTFPPAIANDIHSARAKCGQVPCPVPKPKRKYNESKIIKPNPGQYSLPSCIFVVIPFDRPIQLHYCPMARSPFPPMQASHRYHPAPRWQQHAPPPSSPLKFAEPFFRSSL